MSANISTKTNIQLCNGDKWATFFSYRRFLYVMSVLIATVILSACDKKDENEKKTGQALVSVNGDEITVHQLNDELRRARVQADQHEAASKQLLESLIGRQLAVAEGVRNKLDRTPEVMQAIERARAQIIAQAYMQSITSKIARPSKAEIEQYYQEHPEFFAQRKLIDMTVLRIAKKDFSDEFKSFIDTEKSPNEGEVIAWLDKRNIQFVRSLASRTTANFPKEMAAKLLEKGNDHIFIINERDNNNLMFVNAIKDSPVTLAVAAPQIEQFLMNNKHKEAMEAEITRLRSSAEIKYLGELVPSASVEEERNVEETAGITDTNNSDDVVIDESIERGIKDLILR